MVARRFDAIVVGAGPAGLLASEELARRGFSVAVLERESVLGRKSCGGFLTLGGMREGGVPLSLGERVIREVALVLPGGRVCTVDYPHPVGIQLRREDLGVYLGRRASDAGAQIFLSHRVVGCRRGEGGWFAEVEGYEAFWGRLLIGADGVSSTVARLTGLRRRFSPDQLGVTVQAQVELSPEVIDERFDGRMEVYYGRDVCPFGYAWIFPKRDCLYVGLGSLLQAAKGSLRPYLEYFMQRHPVASSRVEGGRVRLVEGALVPLTYQLGSFGEGVLLAGDAAGHCSAITGEGIHYSMVAGRIAGRVGAEALERGDVSARRLSRYERMWRRAFGGDLRLGVWLRDLFYEGTRTGGVGEGMAGDPGFLRLAVDLIVGLRPYRYTLMRALPRYAWHRLTSFLHRLVAGGQLGLSEKLRLSVGTAAVLGLLRCRVDTLPTTAYTMIYIRGRCSANCSFCTQARSSQAAADRLSRVTWPAFPISAVFDSLRRGGERLPFRRLCIQTLCYPSLMRDLLRLVKGLRGAVPHLPISAAIPPLPASSLEELKEAGVERVAVSLDTATPQLFQAIKGAGVGSPFSWEGHLHALEAAVRVFGSRHTTTHLILGLGETEKEAAMLIQRLADKGLTVGLFAFTPLPGTRLAGRPQPPIDGYRRLQLAHYLITHRMTRVERMTFDPGTHRITGFGLSGTQLRKVVTDGQAFRTTGCPGCNRPFYNEKPSGPIYNYPAPPTSKELRDVIRQLGGVV